MSVQRAADVVLAAGFPGQSRTLPDLYYNRHRDYDPTTGRYIQADPIGLDGGPNSYVYAGNNPLRYVDPEGLSTAGNVGGAIGGALGLAITRNPVGASRGAALGRTAGEIINKLCFGGDCPPCTPYPVGTIGFQYKINVRGGRDVGIPHYILYEVQQIPSTCKCIWRERTKACQAIIMYIFLSRGP